MLTSRSLSLLLALVLVAGCAHGRGRGDGKGAAAGPASLALVPADTPYAMAMLEPFDRVLAEKFMAMAGSSLDKTLAQLKEVGGPLKDSPGLTRLLVAVLEELRGNVSFAGAQKLGFNPSGRMVIYGLGIYPVFRVEIADARTLRATIDRVLARAEVQLPEHRLGEQAYWRIDADGPSVVLALVGGELVAGVFPSALVADALPYLFGHKKPARSLRDTGVLAEIARTHGLDPRFVGYGDLRATAALFLGGQPGALPLPPEVAGELAGLPASCKQEAARLVALAPRLVFGYDRLDERLISMRMTLETAAEVSQAVAALSRPAPGLALLPEGPPLAAFGAGIDANAAIALARRAALAVIRQPFECPAFSGLNEAAHEVEQGLAQALPPYVTGVSGVMVTLDELDIESRPIRVRGSAVLVGSGVGELVRLAIGLISSGQSVPLSADGRPVALPLTALGVPGLDQAYLGLKGERAAIAVGKGASERVVALLGAKAPERAPLIMFGMHFARLAEVSRAFADEVSDETFMGGLNQYGFAGYGLEADARKGITFVVQMQLE